MNFPPIVKAWLMLLTLAFSTGIAAGYTAYLTGSSKWGAFIVGFGTAATNIYNRLSASPADKVEKAAETANAQPSISTP